MTQLFVCFVMEWSEMGSVRGPSTNLALSVFYRHPHRYPY